MLTTMVTLSKCYLPIDWCGRIAKTGPIRRFIVTGILIIDMEITTIIGIEIIATMGALGITEEIEEPKIAIAEAIVGVDLTVDGRVQKVDGIYSLRLKGTDLGRERLIVIDGTPMSKIHMNQMYIDRTMERHISIEMTH